MSEIGTSIIKIVNTLLDKREKNLNMTKVLNLLFGVKMKTVYIKYLI